MNTSRLFLSFILLLSITTIFAQNSNKLTSTLTKQITAKSDNTNFTVWIFFTDKGDNLNKKLSQAASKISQRSLERRQKLFKNKSSLVTFYDIPVLNTYVNAVTPFLSKLRHQSKWLNAISAEVAKSDLKKIAAFDFVKTIDVVRTRKYDKALTTETAPTKSAKNTNYNLNYGASLTQLEQINVPLVHDMGYSGNGLIICVLDAGFNNLEHQSFDNMTIIDSYDFVNDDNNVDDQSDMGTGNHGTKTLSTIGGFYEGELIGPAYGASYLLAKTENTDSETQVEEDNWIAGAQWAEGLGADITSTSLGYIDFDDGSGYDASELDGNTAPITIAADIMAGLGVLVVNSAGNSGSGTTTIGAPADGNEVLAVGAVNSSGVRTSFSSVGPTGDGRIKPEVMAMGSGVVVANTSGDTYTTARGTSFSCPLTAGAAALVWEMVPTASNMDIFEALKMSANNADNPNNEYGWGIINVYAAYQYLALPNISSTPLTNTEDFTGPYTVNAVVTSRLSLVADSPKLHYRVNGGAWTSVNMNNTAGDNYSADIPGTGSQAYYDYYITAENTNALVSLPENAPTNYFSFVASEAPEITHTAIKEYYIKLWNQAKVKTDLIDASGVDSNNSFVEWKRNGTPQANIPFTDIVNNTYTANFPDTSVAVGDVIAYRIVAQDLSSSQNISVSPNSGYYNFTITNKISFEQNQFSHNWIFEEDADWFITSTTAQEGTYAAQSGDINNSQRSSISISFTSSETGNVSFFKKVSSENNYDYLKFYIDGSLENEWSGDISWGEENYTVNTGSHTLKWEYFKDTSVSSGEDTAWVDNITLPSSATGITIFNQSTMTLYPNPANNVVYLDFEDKNLKQVDVEIYNSIGKQVKVIKNYNAHNAIDFSKMTRGVYLFKIKVQNKIEVLKLILTK